MRRARGPIFPVPGSRRGSRWGPREMLHRQRGGCNKNSGGVQHTTLPISAVALGFFRDNPADPSRASGEGNDGSDPSFFAAGAARRVGGCNTWCNTRCNTFPPCKAGSLPSEIIHAGRFRRPPTGASGRADGRHDGAARRRVFADRRRYVQVVRVALGWHVPRR